MRKRELRSERYGDGEIIAYHGGRGWKTGGAQPGGDEKRWIARESGAELPLLVVELKVGVFCPPPSLFYRNFVLFWVDFLSTLDSWSTIAYTDLKDGDNHGADDRDSGCRQRVHVRSKFADENFFKKKKKNTGARDLVLSLWFKFADENYSKIHADENVGKCTYIPTKQNRETWALEKGLRTLILNVVEERTKSGGDENDLLQMLLEGAKNCTELSQNGTERFVVDNCKSMYLGGYETTAVSAEWCLMLLAANQEWQGRVRAEVLQICAGRIPDYDMIRKMKQNNKSSSKSKHIDIKFLVVKERVRNHLMSIEYISTELMIADPLTKGLPPKVFKEHVARAGVVNSNELETGVIKDHIACVFHATYPYLIYVVEYIEQKREKLSFSDSLLSRLLDENMKYYDLLQLTMVLNESLRLYPPVATISREALKDMKFGDIEVPKGVHLMCPIVALQTDPEFWGPDSYEFKPERFANGIAGACKLPHLYMPFRAGPRGCLGQFLALAELKLLIALILSNFSFTLSPDYVHSPAFHMVIEPEHGVDLVLKKL
ncbi:hypothetical protein RHSIM_Rhsim10G0046400 [Rhododendron simsii]|uniref:Cytochrome P450 n=1 Tax=Rhododendron simsii TaxID=118357 RepID=A0A834GDX1_RHOSS|nr:hypothetical protein RHSIM_Rhsim10G0046400 [Rhododendron simsii]